MLGFIVNCGSSSIKVRLIDTDTQETLFESRAEHLNSSSSKVVTSFNNVVTNLFADYPRVSLSHEDALKAILKDLKQQEVISNLEDISFVGHRIVHGGSFFSKPTIITEEVIKKISECSELAPLHNPVGILGIRCCEELLPSAIHVAVFDTAFHQDIPEVNFRYAIPDKFYCEGIRKYGFHGTSYAYLTRKLRENVGEKNISAIMAHIGQGTSVCAVKKGKSVYTSMEFSPLSGCIMGTRSGSIDPTVVQFLCKKYDCTIEQVMSILNNDSGLYALTGYSNMIDILNGLENNNHSCIFALDLFCESLAENIAKAIIYLGERPKQIVFSGGIGENSDIVRYKILEKLTPIIGNINLDVIKNTKNEYIITQSASLVSVNGEFSSPKKNSEIAVYVIKANEELEIALEAAKLL